MFLIHDLPEPLGLAKKVEDLNAVKIPMARKVHKDHIDSILSVSEENHIFNMSTMRYTDFVR